MRAVTRRNIFAMVVRSLLAGVPLVAFNFWLEGLIDRQGEVEVGTAAKRAIALAEAHVRDTVGALDGLAARGVNSCETGQFEAMRYAVFSTIPVKEVAVSAQGYVFAPPLPGSSFLQLVEAIDPLQPAAADPTAVTGERLKTASA